MPLHHSALCGATQVIWTNTGEPHLRFLIGKRRTVQSVHVTRQLCTVVASLKLTRRNWLLVCDILDRSKDGLFW